MDAAALVDRVLEAVEGRDADAFAGLFAEDAVGYHPLSPEPVRGRAAIRESEKSLFDSFSDVHIEVRSVAANDDKVAVEVILTATNTGNLDLGGGNELPATGRTVTIPATWWYEVGPEGLVVESRDYFDTGMFMAQLGLV